MPGVASIGSIAADAARRLQRSGLDADTALRDAALLARWVLGWDEARWIADRREPPPASFDGRFHAAIERRALREPISYITGVREFYGRPFAVTAAVLIPRPETELLVDAALAVLPPTRPARAIDVGTGSGSVAISLALERPLLDVLATDTSPAALAVARANVAALAPGRVTCLEIDLAGAGPPLVDVIVSNPPYVAEIDRPALDAGVRDFEPAAALFGGSDGLAVIRRLLPAAADRLVPGGWLFVEIGAGQADAAAVLVSRTAGLVLDGFTPDGQGIPRVLRARRIEGARE